MNKFYNRESLHEQDKVHEMNPITFLAMELMRNNPKHSVDIREHPYYKLMMEHVQQNSRKTK
jgi:hypothetical protein